MGHLIMKVRTLPPKAQHRVLRTQLDCGLLLGAPPAENYHYLAGSSAAVTADEAVCLTNRRQSIASKGSTIVAKQNGWSSVAAIVQILNKITIFTKNDQQTNVRAKCCTMRLR